MKYACTECGHEIIDNSQSCECGCEDHDNSTEKMEVGSFAL